jgi:hypothetical protein
VIVAVTDDEPRLLTVERSEHVPGGAGGEAPALPFGPLDPASHRTLELGLRGWVREQTGLELGYVEQLYTFADRNRDPRERAGGPRLVSIGYLALVKEGRVAGESQARWRGFYEFLPWEDARRGARRYRRRRGTGARALGPPRRRTRRRARSAGASRHHLRLARRRVRRGPRARALRAALRGRARGGGRPRRSGTKRLDTTLGEPMALDHRRLMATALGRLRGKLKYRPVVFELLPASFTLLRLQRLVEALAGAPLHKQNFRRLVETGGLVEGPASWKSAPRAVPRSFFASDGRCCASGARPVWGSPARLIRPLTLILTPSILSVGQRGCSTF